MQMDERLKGFTKPTVCGMKKRRTNNSFIGHVDEKSETPPFFSNNLGGRGFPTYTFYTERRWHITVSFLPHTRVRVHEGLTPKQRATEKLHRREMIYPNLKLSADRWLTSYIDNQVCCTFINNNTPLWIQLWNCHISPRVLNSLHLLSMARLLAAFIDHHPNV